MARGLGRRDALAASALGLTSLALPAAALAASPGVESGPPAPVVDADALVQAATPSTNYGTQSMLLKNFGTVFRMNYVRFDLTGTDWTVAAAPALTLTTNANNDGGTTPVTFAVEVYGLREDAAGYAWGEMTITWNTRPAPGALVSGRYPPGVGATLLGELAVPAVVQPDPCTFTSDALRTFIRGLTQPSVTFILIRKDTNNNNLSFTNREVGANGPVLTLG